MNRSVFMVMALALVLAPAGAMAKPPIGDGGDPTGQTGSRGDFESFVSLESSSGKVFCEVWRDYYYDADTEAFLGWAGPPYIKSETCQSTDGGDGSGPDCPPGDIPCLCAGPGNAGNPACEGGGPLGPDPDPPSDCVEVGQAKACKTGSASCQTCKEKKRKACDECIKTTKSTNQKITDDYRSCTSKADASAASQCKQGRLPNGKRFGDWVKVDQCIASFRQYPDLANKTDDEIYQLKCKSQVAIPPTTCTVGWDGQTECLTAEEYTACVNLWNYGRDAQQTTFETSGNAGWSGGGATVSIGGKETVTVTWGAEKGAYEQCKLKQTAQKGLRDQQASECKGAVNAKYQGEPKCI